MHLLNVRFHFCVNSLRFFEILTFKKLSTIRVQIKVAEYNFRDGAIRRQILRSIHQRYVLYFCASSRRFRDLSIFQICDNENVGQGCGIQFSQFDDKT